MRTAVAKRMSFPFVYITQGQMVALNYVQTMNSNSMKRMAATKFKLLLFTSFKGWFLYIIQTYEETHYDDHNT
jgi:hypothetical protein